MIFSNCPTCGGTKWWYPPCEGKCNGQGYFYLPVIDGDTECSDCQGSGKKPTKEPCPTCQDSDGNPTGRIAVLSDDDLKVLLNASGGWLLSQVRKPVLAEFRYRANPFQLTHRKEGGGE